MSDLYFAGRRCALVIGHPGHELRVWGWMHAVRPSVAVITDGAGHHGRPRLELSRQICELAGATPSEHFGLVSDAELYAAILSGDPCLFLQMADRLATWMHDAAIDVVVGDAVEGYNPTHDLCRAVIDRAVRQMSPGRRVETFAIELTGAPRPPAAGRARTVTLRPGDLPAKIEACRAYGTAVGGTLLGEIDDLLARHGADAFACEHLLYHDAWATAETAVDGPPYYERYGEQQVAAGHYEHVIRHDEHIAPIVRALRH